ncbi:hypothetical protein C8R47DRAFT_1326947 [Mycena vitilis]|nr:hypothetical protein C8R47DRAFT_1326947 [Mycena vitilis]
MACGTFSNILQECFILHFDLLRFPQTDKPFLAQIDFGVGPTDLRDFAKIFTGQPLGKKKVQGMVKDGEYQSVVAPIVIGDTALEFVRMTPTLKYYSRTGELAHTGDANECRCMPRVLERVYPIRPEERARPTHRYVISDIKIIREADGPRARSDDLASLILKLPALTEEGRRETIHWD